MESNLPRLFIWLVAGARTEIHITESNAVFVYTQRLWKVEGFDPKHGTQTILKKCLLED
jgi:hypothetical protein